MFPNEDLQRWAGRTCLLLVGALGMMGYYFANVRFLPLVAGFAILAGVCYAGQTVLAARRPLRDSGKHRAP
jgi:drug/metabolite transporter (DMT)-like permease